jgi:hypothetical protein
MTRPASRFRALRSAFILSVLACLSGCNAYVLKGRVIQGDISIVAVVPADDPRVMGDDDSAGVANAAIRLETDPARINREIVGETVANADGYFEIPFRKMGGSIMMYDVGITGRGKGFTPATLAFKLPPSNKRVLIILKPGADAYNDPYEDSLDNQVKKFKDGG